MMMKFKDEDINDSQISKLFWRNKFKKERNFNNNIEKNVIESFTNIDFNCFDYFLLMNFSFLMYFSFLIFSIYIYYFLY